LSSEEEEEEAGSRKESRKDEEDKGKGRGEQWVPLEEKERMAYRLGWCSLSF